MRRKLILAALLFALCPPWVSAQQQNFPGGGSINDYIVSTLPTGQPVGTLAIVTDGNGYSCTSGSSTTVVLCFYNGTSWTPIGPTGSGSGTVTSFSASSTFSPLFTTSVATPTTTPALSFALISQSQNLFFASPNGSSGNGAFRAIVSADVPTLNQNTTGTAAKWTTARLLAGNSTDGSANVPFANAFIVQGTTDSGLTGAQFLGALGTGIIKNTTTTGVLSIAIPSDFPTLNQNTSGTAANLSGTPALPNGTTATTQACSDSSTKIASTSFVQTCVYQAVNPAVAAQAATTQASDTSGFTYSNGVSGIGATFTGSVNTAVTIDGFTFTALGQRLLVKNDTQSPSGAFNGIYYVTQVQTGILAPILTRALDYDQPSDINNTGAIPVINGTANAGTTWVETATVNTIGTDPLSFTQFSLNPSNIVTQTSNASSGQVCTYTGSNKICVPATALPNGITATSQSSGDNSTKVATTAYVDAIPKTKAIGWAFGDVATGTALTTAEVGYVTVPFACTITGWHMMSSTSGETDTVKTWRVNGGTALPTSGNSISTSGVGLTGTGGKIDSTTVTDFTSTAIAANDTLAFAITAVTAAKQITFQLDCKTI